MSTPPTPPPTNLPAGYYDDPGGSGKQRWWSGDGWTDALRDKPATPEKKKGKTGRIVGVLAALFLVGTCVNALGGGDDPGTSTTAVRETAGDTEGNTEGDTAGDTAATPQETQDEPSAAALYPERPDRQPEDQEVAVGEQALIAGMGATVHAASIATPEFGDPFLKVDVSIVNENDSSADYASYDFQLLTPGGRVIDPTWEPDSLDSATLVSGARVDGWVPFDVGDERGDFFVLYKPDPYDAARGVWKITV